MAPHHSHCTDPYIYVASLLDHRCGVLHGTWLDATRHPLALLDDVTAMIAGSPTVALTGELAEEWASSAIFDAEGLRPTHRPTRVTRADPRPGDASITRPPDVIS